MNHPYMEKHPTPWTLKQRDVDKGDTNDGQEIIDANGNTIISTEETENYTAWFGGDIHGLINMINTTFPPKEQP